MMNFLLAFYRESVKVSHKSYEKSEVYTFFLNCNESGSKSLGFILAFLLS